jgi:dTDP-4-dehydrorhamnose 3,5-epimerase
VAVDIRVNSPTFGQSFSVVLSAENKRQIFIPHGFAHGFCVLSEYAEFLYKCDDYYAPGDEYGIAWNDPNLAIEWGVAEPLLSARDQMSPLLAELPVDHLPIFRS